MGKRPLLLLFVFSLAAAIAIFAPGGAKPDSAEAQEVFTRPTNLRASPVAGGVLVDWQRGQNNTFFCVDTAFNLNDLLTFSGSWRNWGCGTTGTSLVLDQLRCGTPHVWRVWAAGPGVSAHSAPAQFTTQPCPFSAPSNLQSTVISHDTVRVSWARGTNNSFFCVDTALSQSDLLSFSGTWRNSGCGTTSTSLVVSGLQADTQYFWRVWAAGVGASGHSNIRTFTTAEGDFLPPNQLSTTLSGDNIIFSWNERSEAFFFCVDVAESESDLVNFGSTFQNFDCGGSNQNASVDADNFECGETHHWRVFAFAGSLQGYSGIETFVIPCP